MQKVQDLFYKGIFDNKTEKEIYKLARGISKQEIQESIAKMLESGDLVYASKGRLRVPYLEGKLQGNRRGFAFFISENGGQDLFIKSTNLHGAVHGDTVLVKKIGGRKGDEAVVVKLLKRNTTIIVGQYIYGKFGGKVIPDDSGYTQDVLIENGVISAVQGEKVVVKITRQLEDGTLYGQIVEVLGLAGELTVEENAILAEHKLPQEFSKQLLNYAEKVSGQKILVEGRLDLREKLCITIDGDDSRDYDDAITIERTDKGYLLGVHIADVTHYVKRGDLLDSEAYERGTSVYFPDRVLPMLPEALSNGACSLNAGEDKYTLSCIMHLDRHGNLLDRQIVNSVICSKYRMTYKKVAKLLDGDMALQKEYADIIEFCYDFAEITRALIEKRKARGSIDLDIDESQITVNDGKIEIVRYERTFAHRMIEEAMILANETVAKFVEEKGLPFVYRVHEQPVREKAVNFSTFLHSLGIEANFDVDDVQPMDYAKIIKSLQWEVVQQNVHKIMLRSMSKARYSHINSGHFGLASASYAHFTSPIRRYPDLLIHRIIKHILQGENEALKSFNVFVEKASVQCSLRERRAEDCERAVDELFKVFYMQNFVGQTFSGKVSGVTNFAVFVELENSIEGHIKIENLPKDSYSFIEEKFLLQGAKQSYGIGNTIEVKLMRCDIAARKIEFVPIDFDASKLIKRRSAIKGEKGKKGSYSKGKLNGKVGYSKRECIDKGYRKGTGQNKGKYMAKRGDKGASRSKSNGRYKNR